MSPESGLDRWLNFFDVVFDNYRTEIFDFLFLSVKNMVTEYITHYELKGVEVFDLRLDSAEFDHSSDSPLFVV